jgi:flagellar basal-body rod protein FlgB
MLRCMGTGTIGLFNLAERRLAWTDRRQTLLAQNIANANTPGFRPKDLTPFAATLQQHAGTLARTQPNHMTGATPDATAQAARQGSKSLDGNAVKLDEQLVKVADTETTQSLVTTIYKKYLGMFSLALGRSSTG